MKKDLIDGYIFEVTKSLPRGERKNFSEKLEKELNEKIENRKKGEFATEDEISDVLKEYGDASDFSAKYSKYGKKSLVPQPYFAHYISDKRIANITAAIFLIFFHMLLSVYSQTSQIVVSAIFDTVSDIIAAWMIIYFSFTIAFSLTTSQREKSSWDKFFKSIRPEPDKKNKIGGFAIAFQAVISTMLFIIAGFAFQIFGFEFDNLIVGEYMFHILVPVGIVYFVSVFNLAFKEVSRRYDTSVLLSTLLKDVLIIALSFVLFVQNETVAGELSKFFEELIMPQNFLKTVVSNSGVFIFLVMVIFCVIDILINAINYHSDRKVSVKSVEKPPRANVEKTPNVENTKYEFKKPSDKEIEEPKAEVSETINISQKLQDEIKKSDGEDIKDDIANTRVLNRSELKETTDEKPQNKIAEAVRRANPDNK